MKDEILPNDAVNMLSNPVIERLSICLLMVLRVGYSVDLHLVVGRDRMEMEKIATPSSISSAANESAEGREGCLLGRRGLR